MKKLISIALSAAMLGAMAIPAVSAVDTAAQTSPASFPSGTTGTIELTKYETVYNTDGTIVSYEAQKAIVDDTSATAEAKAAAQALLDKFKKVSGATFTATQVLKYNAGTKDYTVNDTVFDDITLTDVLKDADGNYTSYGTSTELENQIAKMRLDVAKADAEDLTDIQFKNDGDTEGVYSITVPYGVYLVEETGIPSVNGHDQIVSTQAFLVSIPQFDAEDNEWDTTVTALPKNTTVDVDKKIDTASADNTTNDSSDAVNIGDIVPYTVTVQVPNYGMSASYQDENLTVTKAVLKHAENGVDRYNSLDLIFTDTLTAGLTLLPESVKIVVGPANIELTRPAANAVNPVVKQGQADGTITTGYDYTVTSSDAQHLSVDVEWAALELYQGQTLTLTYKAQVNEAAVAGTANNNTVTVSFANDPNDWKPDATDPTRKTDTDTDNDVYTYELNLDKTFDGKTAATATDEDATKVVFTLTRSDNTPVLFKSTGTAGRYTVWSGHTYVKNSGTDSAQTYAVPEESYKADSSTYTQAEINTFTTPLTANISPDADGKLIVTGLKDDTYVLTETKTSDGYSLLTAPVTFTLSEVKKDSVVQPQVTAVVKESTDRTLKANSQAYYAELDSTLTAEQLAERASSKNTDGTFDLIVNNPKAKFFSLPTTGGLGLWMFTIGGGVLMAGAIIFISVLRRKKNA